MKKTIHIVVKDGLVQAVYADKDLDIDVVLYDLDTDDNEEYDTLITTLTEVRKSGANLVY
jgi:hypothetical protein